MAFTLSEFDKMTDLEASDYLFQAMCEDPLTLCNTLRTERPILRFWSRHPDNPDHLVDAGGKRAPVPGYAYLLTNERDVRFALERFSMRSYSRPRNRYFLAIDDEHRHESLRTLFENAMHAVDTNRIRQWMVEAVEEAWDLQLNAYQGGRLTLDVRQFSRETVLRFCGRLYGLPRHQVIGGEFRQWTSTAFEQFIWKLFARHFEPSPQGGAEAIRPLGRIAFDALHVAGRRALDREDPVTFTDHLFRMNWAQPDDALRLSNRDLVSNLIGAFQGFIDNAVSCTCIALEGLVNAQADATTPGSSPPSKGDGYLALQAAVRAKDERGIAALMRSAQRAVPPAPWLPRVGNVVTLPGWPPAESDRQAISGGNTGPFDEAPCVLAMGSAMSQPSITLPDPIYPDVKRNDASRYADPEDLRMGHGFHRCVGLDLGDTLVVQILKRIATLNDIRDEATLSKQWSWICTEYVISGEAGPEAVATRWSGLPGSQRMAGLSLDGSNAPMASTGSSVPPTVSSISTAEFRGLPPSTIAQLSDEQVASLSDAQLRALTDRQLQALSDASVSALGEKIRVLSAERLIMLSTAALAGLSEEQIDRLDDEQIEVLFLSRRGDLAAGALSALAQRFNQLQICKLTRGIQPRPFALSLWSDAFSTDSTADYTTWPGLIDRQWTARHRSPASETYLSTLPELGAFQSEDSPGHTTDLFARPAGKPQLSRRTNVLFTWFAQWVSDSFLRTHLGDRRRNESNHEIDLCQIYGLDTLTTQLLRSHVGGRLRTMQFDDSGEYLPLLFGEDGKVKAEFQALPYVQSGRLRSLMQTSGFSDEKRAALFATGLAGGNSSFGYAAISTLFVREHNRICKALSVANPSWTDERLFQTTRLILTALAMKLIVEEYINHIAGSEAEQLRLYQFDTSFAERESWYRPNRITLEFNLLYRWHSLVPDHYRAGTDIISSIDARMNNLPLLQHGLATLIMNACGQPAGKPGLFNTERSLLAAEHAALTMSRTYRVDSFDAYRTHFGLGPIGSFDNLTDDERVIDVLRHRYVSTSRLEFLVGLYAEEPIGDGLFGTLMTRMLAYDAFTQIFTNPLLSRNVFREQTFSKVGMDIINETTSLADVWERNGGDDTASQWLTFSLS